MNSEPVPPETRIGRREFLRSAGIVALVGAVGASLAACGSDAPSAAKPRRSATFYREEGCSCCVVYADYLRDNGFAVSVETLDDLGPIRRKHKVPDDGIGCHTSVIDSYVIEGHVPVEAINRLLSERPALDGITVIGMPAAAPGMGEPNGTPLTILSINRGRVADYMSVTDF